MTKIYIKIFLSFWVISILTFLGADGVSYWFNLRPDYGLYEYRDNPYDRYALSSLNKTISFIININSDDIRSIVQEVDDWVFENIFFVDESGEELRGRELSPEVEEVLSHLSLDTPFHLLSLQDQTFAGRYVVLRNGETIRIVSAASPASSRRNFWLFYIRESWVFFALSTFFYGVACLFLAMYLSKGLRTLRDAIREIAKGDLSVRIAPRFANRRDEIGELSREFDHMASRLEASMTEQKRLIKDVSHELRSPLARLQFALGLAKQRSNGVVERELEKIREAADYLNNIISTILAFPTSEADSWELNDAVDIKALLETLKQDYEEEAKTKGVNLEFMCELEEALVSTYGTTLTGVFENVVNNALHYTLPNTRVIIKLSEDSEHYTVTVTDHGPGVNDAELSSIFEPFYRTDEARDRASGGYGLGLSIAQRTVALHKGRIEAHNHVDGGLVVKIILPKGDFE